MGEEGVAEKHQLGLAQSSHRAEQDHSSAHGLVAGMYGRVVQSCAAMVLLVDFVIAFHVAVPHGASRFPRICSPRFRSFAFTCSSSVISDSSKHTNLDVQLGQRQRRPNGYWKVFKNVKNEVFQLVDQLGLDGVMPTEAQLRKHKLSSLSDALHEMGGYAVVGEKLGLRTSKPKGYWTDFDNVVAELKDFMQGLGERLPTQAEIREAGRFDLISGMQVHGGMQVFAEHLDITMAKHKSRLSGYSMKRRLCDELLKFVEDRGLSGVMPNQQLLIVWGRDDLARGVERHGGRAQVAKYVGLEVKQADGELEMVGIEIKEIAAQMGKPEVMPAVRELLKRNRGDLAAQVEKRGWEMCASLLGLRVTDVIPSRTQVRKVVHEPSSEATASPEAALKIASSASSKIVDAPLHRGVRGGGVAVYEDDRTHVSCLVVRGRRESLLNEEQLPQQMSDLRKRMRSKLNRRGSRPGSATSAV